MEPLFVKDRLRLLLDHFGEVRDPREAAKVRYPLREVLFLVACATIAGCDDYDEIADWGEHHLGFLKSYSEYYWGAPKEDWLRVVLNRIDPALFEACFMAWAVSLRPDAADLIALDGKTLRRSGDGAAETKPLHLVSAWASSQRLVLAQEAVDAKENECAAILAILGRMTLKGALVTIDAIATNPTVAQAIIDAGGDYVLALKRNQPSLHDEIARYFADPATTGIAAVETTDKDHGRIETRRTAVSHDVAWLAGDRRYPDEPRFPGLASLVMTTTRTERRGKATTETRYFLSSAKLSPQRAGEAIRAHWGVESLHWVLDVVFREDQSRLRRGHGARNMALVRRLAFNLVRAGRGKRSIKTARKAAGWNPAFLASLIMPPNR
ncbi:MAG TPA: ISAs1 family transposase [Roseiarcus sp.]|nr:ISAs1 family transposase [Roseiarcus sp.]